MREIKFRGKRTDNGEWVYGDFNRYSEDESTITVDLLEQETHWVQTETVGQYTGLKDKNGREIYEGDLLKTEENEIYRVAFVESSCAFVACFYPDDYDTVYLVDTCPNTYDEVIGNIHEQKEGEDND